MIINENLKAIEYVHTTLTIFVGRELLERTIARQRYALVLDEHLGDGDFGGEGGTVGEARVLGDYRARVHAIHLHRKVLDRCDTKNGHRLEGSFAVHDCI